MEGILLTYCNMFFQYTSYILDYRIVYYIIGHCILLYFVVA